MRLCLGFYNDGSIFEFKAVKSFNKKFEIYNFYNKEYNTTVFPIVSMVDETL